MDIVGTLKSFGISSKHSDGNDDLFIDRLNHRYTVVIICTFVVVITVGQYSGNRINCWSPGHFNGNYQAYADDIW
jgi:hypothetical protein